MDHTFLWLLNQRQNRAYSTFDSCVVAADTEDEAKLITPDSLPFMGDLNKPHKIASAWAFTVAGVDAEKIGVTQAERRGLVIISSYNGG